MRRPCFPNSGSHQHGPPLLGRVRTPPRSPTSTLFCSPPTPSSPSAAAPVVPRQRPTSVRRLVLHRRTGASADRCNAGDISTPAPHKPALSRGETRGSQVPGPSSSCVPWSYDPAGCVPPLAHLSVRSLLPSGEPIPWAPGNIFLSWLPTHGPLARVPTLRRIRYRLRRKARYRPGGLTLGRAGFAPAG